MECPRPVRDTHPRLATYTRPLRDLAPDQLPLVGAKALGLSRIRSLGFQVPEGLVMETSAFDLMCRHADATDRIQWLQTHASTLQEDHVLTLGADIVRRLQDTAWPPSLMDELRRGYEALGGGRPSLACRSSSPLEDSAEHAFPGRFRTTLHLETLEELAQAVTACWCSPFTERALRYGRRLIPHRSVSSIAVILQHMAPSAVAGVAAYWSPEAIEVEAVPGTGEALMSGGVPPVQFRKQKGSGWQCLADGGRGATAVEIMTEGQLDRLAQIAATLEKAWGTPVDVEFAFAPQAAEPFILQCRPITRGGPSLDADPRAGHSTGEKVFFGQPCSPGRATGRGIDYDAFTGSRQALRGTIVLLPALTDQVQEIIYAAAGVVTERRESRWNHLAIACRELGIPYVSGVFRARKSFRDRIIHLDGEQGSVTLVPISPAEQNRNGAGIRARTSAVVPPFPPDEQSVNENFATALGPSRLPNGLFALLEALYRGTDERTIQTEMVRTIREQVGETPAGASIEAIDWPSPEFSSEEAAWLNACVDDLCFTPEAVRRIITRTAQKIERESGIPIRIDRQADRESR